MAIESGQIKVTLRAPDGRKYSFSVQETDNDQISLMVGDKVVAIISVETMTKEVKDEDGDYHIKPSDNFYVNFVATDAVAKRECSAMAWVGS
jgi:hypothetical protein